MTQVLILNSDSPHNKGDQAILLGSIRLIRSRWPDADITAISEFKTRDEKWFGIKFIEQKVYSLNPFSLLKLSFKARAYDKVFWGGGELLKDYTTKVAPIYWLIRIILLRALGVHVSGLFQGIGPTNSKISRWAIKKTVNLCDIFFVRDQESQRKLAFFGVKNAKVISGFDPAILNKPTEEPEVAIRNTLLTHEFIKNSVIVGVRKWFHYARGQWTPLALQRSVNEHQILEYEKYKQNLTNILKNLIEEQNVNVILFPMFTSANEGDKEFSEEIAKQLPNNRSIVLDSEKISPQDMVDLFSLGKATIATRLHSSIVSVTSGTPALCLFYVDKGREFYRQIKADDFCFAIEDILNPNGLNLIESSAKKLIERPQNMANCFSELRKMQSHLTAIFKENT